MNKHTPGPWGHWIDAGKYVVTGPSAAHAMVAEKAIRNSDHLGAGWRDSFHVLSHIGRVPALALGDSEEEAKANARLIAAAPDLLQALQLVAAHIPEIIASGILTAAETDTIRASITKAGG